AELPTSMADCRDSGGADWLPAGHARPAAFQASGQERFLYGSARFSTVSGRNCREWAAARGRLSLHRDDWRRRYTGRLHAVPGYARSIGSRPRTLQHLLRALSLASGRRPGHGSITRLRQDAAIVSYTASAEGAFGLLLRRDDPWFWHHAGLCRTDSAARPLGDRCLHSRSAVESECAGERYTCGAAASVSGA